MKPDTLPNEMSDPDSDAGEAWPRGRTGDSRQTTQAERAVMHPDRDDPEWRYYHQIWES